MYFSIPMGEDMSSSDTGMLCYPRLLTTESKTVSPWQSGTFQDLWMRI
jgi:hypothetical protein